MPSPMMIQYSELKEQYPDDILFFRLGDFYEMFQEDAKIGARALDLVLTQRKNKADGAIPMCGVPYHSAEGYISKLISQGYSVAICEQVEDANASKGIVKRDVVRVVTPGTVLIDSALDQQTPVYIAAVMQTKAYSVVALADLSSGDFRAGYVSPEEVFDVLQLYSVREVVLPAVTEAWQQAGARHSIKITSESKWSFDVERAKDLLAEHFSVASLEGFGFEADDPRLGVAGGLLSYLKYTQHADLVHISELKVLDRSSGMRLDANTVENLELLYPSRASRKAKSVFEVINATQNPMGARVLRSWLVTPLTDIAKIQDRQRDAEYLRTSPKQYQTMQVLLGNLPDVERTLSRLSAQTGGPRDMAVIAQMLRAVSDQQDLFPSEVQTVLQTALAETAPLQEELTKGLVENPPILVRDGGFVSRGYRTDIDELLDLAKGGKDWLVSVEARERHNTGISNLKIRYNKVFGYFIEVSKSHLDKVPAGYIKKQTLVNAERFITEELKEFEDKILASEEQLLTKEHQLFYTWLEQILAVVQPIQRIVQILAYWDAIGSFATLALEKGYTLPEITPGSELAIEEGRHPVVEQLVTDEFIPNDTHLTQDAGTFMLITGPNMAGKSTYIRQVALIVLLAQIGCYVPAAQAQIGVCDRIFTRVGASDNLSEGQSTFMVEMVEVANILRNATDKSLIILDEVGRGTSTYDGMSIARAISEHIHDQIGARTLFATHYHELLSLASERDRITNYRVLVEESQGSVRFLRKIEVGGIDKSYGIAIAQLAGFPREVLRRAEQALVQYESEPKKQQPSLFEGVQTPQKQEDTVWKNRYNDLSDQILATKALEISPLEASQRLHEIQTNLTQEHKHDS